jgi:2-methylcitrate dehydratase PrpD
LNPVLDACRALHNRLGPSRIDAIESIELIGHPLLRQRTDRPNVETGHEAQVSAQHAVPVMLLRGDAGLDAFSDQAVRERKLRDLGLRLCFRDDEACSIDSAEVILKFRDQTTERERTQVARGSVRRPLTDVELEWKLRDLSRYGGSGCDVDHLINAIWSLDDQEDVGILSRLATSSGQVSSSVPSHECAKHTSRKGQKLK